MYNMAFLTTTAPPAYGDCPAAISVGEGAGDGTWKCCSVTHGKCETD